MALIAGADRLGGALVVVELLGHPRGKGRPRRSRLSTGVTITHSHPETAEYEANLRLATQKAMNGRDPLQGPLTVLVEAFFPIPSSWSKRRQEQARAGLIVPTVTPDASNIACITDGCNGILWSDDRSIAELAVIKTYSVKPGLVISVWPARIPFRRHVPAETLGVGPECPSTANTQRIANANC